MMLTFFSLEKVWDRNSLVAHKHPAMLIKWCFSSNSSCFPWNPL